MNEQVCWCHFYNSICLLHVSVSHFGNSHFGNFSILLYCDLCSVIFVVTVLTEDSDDG